MVQTITHKCNSCEFQFKEEDKEFYFNKELNKLTEALLNIKNIEKIATAPISGLVYITYCEECENFIKTYTVTKNETELTDNEIKDLILKYSKYDEFAGKKLVKSVVFDYKLLNDKLISCPTCEKRILKSLTDGSKCPMCDNGKLLAYQFKDFD